MQTKGRDLYSEETLSKVESYLNSLVAGTKERPGARLVSALSKAGITDYKTINPKQLIAFLMNTRKPKIFTESEAALDSVSTAIQNVKDYWAKCGTKRTSFGDTQIGLIKEIEVTISKFGQ